MKRVRVSKATKRASETSEHTFHRKQQDREYKANMRANETREQTCLDIVHYCAEGSAL